MKANKKQAQSLNQDIKNTFSLDNPQLRPPGEETKTHEAAVSAMEESDDVEEEIDDEIYSPQGTDGVPLADAEPYSSGNLSASAGIDSQGSDKLKPKGIISQGKSDSQSPKRKVQFKDDFSPAGPVIQGDEEMPSAVHREKSVEKQDAPTYEQNIVNLKGLENEIREEYNGGNLDGRDKVLVEYVEKANEAAQSLDIEDGNPVELKKALGVLEQCISVLDENRNKRNPLSVLYYETFNNIARCYNFSRNIHMSLKFLMKAMEHVDELALQQEPGQITCIPELSLNICNAFEFLQKYSEALNYAQKAVTSSTECIQCLRRKLNQPIADQQDVQAQRKQEKMSQQYKTQINLNIQGYQRKAQIYETTGNFQDAIREYSFAKNMVEENFGTKSPLFKQIVNSMSGANASQKSQSYSGRQAPGGLFSRGMSSSAKKSSSQVEPKKKKKSSPVGEVRQSQDSFDIRSSTSKSEVTTEMSEYSRKTVQTEQSSQKQSAYSRGNRRLVAKGTRKRSNRPSSARIQQPPFSAGNAQKIGSNKIHNIQNAIRHHEYSLLDPSHTPLVKVNVHKQSVPALRTGDKSGVSNLDRGHSFYYGSGYNTRFSYQPSNEVKAKTTSQQSARVVRIRNGKPRRSIKVSASQSQRNLKSSRLNQKQTSSTSPETDNTQLFEELQKMRSQIKQREMNEIEDRLKFVQSQQMEQQRSVLQALDEQKVMMMENQQKERELARLEREALQSQLSTQDQQSVHSSQYQGAPQQQQQQQMQYMHPQYGPAVFDYNFCQWTYPYAQWFAQQQQYEEPATDSQKSNSPEPAQPKIPEKVLVTTGTTMTVPAPPEPEPVKVPSPRKPSPPKMREFSCQKDFEFVQEKPQMASASIQTQVLEKPPMKEMEVQVEQKPVVSNAETSPMKQPSAKVQELQAIEPQQPSARYTEDQAASIITRRCKMNIMKKREQEYNDTMRKDPAGTTMFTRKKTYNKMNGAMEIFTMYVAHGSKDMRCQALRFSVANYATKKFSYLGQYDKLSHLDEFDVEKLLQLSKASLDEIEFERPPFRMHILCMQAIINTYRVVNKPQKQIKLVKEKEPEPVKEVVVPPPEPVAPPVQQKEPEKIYVEAPAPPKPETREMFTTMHDADDFRILDTDVAYVPPAPEKRKFTNLEAVIFIQASVKRWIQRKWFLLYRSKRLRHIDGQGRQEKRDLLFFMKRKIHRNHFFNIQLFRHQRRAASPPSRGLAKLKQPNSLNYQAGQEVFDLEGKREQSYSLRATETKCSRGPPFMQQDTVYGDLKLPETDPALLRYYVTQATVLELDGERRQISLLKLLRKRLELYNDFKCIDNEYPQDANCYAWDRIGDDLKLGFMLAQYPNMLCQVFKRIRLVGRVKVKDWKIVVIQLDQRGAIQTEDYLVVRRLPCHLDRMEDELQANLGIYFNKRIVPEVILHLYWHVGGRDITVYSQSYYDLTSLRLKTTWAGTYYMSQSNEPGNQPYANKIATVQKIQSKAWDPLYEIYLQVLEAKNPRCPPYRYRTAEQQERKLAFRQHKYGDAGKYGHRLQVWDPNYESSSDSEEDDDPYKYRNDQAYWDPVELEKMQLDEFTNRRQYIKVTITRSNDKQDQDYFRIDKRFARWPHLDCEYQFLMDNLVLRQVANEYSGEININVVGLMLSDGVKYMSDKQLLNSYRTEGQKEVFMVQDVQRWKNQNVVCTVYGTQNIGGGYLIEAINVDKPDLRVYARLPTLGGMRGQILRHYIDACLRFTNSAGSIEESGFGDADMQKIVLTQNPDQFKKSMARDPKFKNWRYEEVDESEAHAASQFFESNVERRQREKIVEMEKQMEDDKNKKEFAADMRKNREDRALKKKHGDMKKALLRNKVQSSDADLEPAQPRIPEKVGEPVCTFQMDQEVTPSKAVKITLTIEKFSEPLYFMIKIANNENPQQDDNITIKCSRLPDGLKISDTDPFKFKSVMKQKLRIIWRAPNADGVRKMSDAFIDNTVVREEIIHRIVEVKVPFDDGEGQVYSPDKKNKVKKEKKEKKSKKDKKSKRNASNSSNESDEEKLNVSEEEYALIKADMKLLKKLIKQIKKNIESRGTPGEAGIEKWFKAYDADGSNEIELVEFIQMVQQLEVVLEDRVGIMLFRLFDRSNQGYFGLSEFLDILAARMIPNYKKIVHLERERFKVHGLDVKRPQKKKPEVRWKERVKEVKVPVEVIKEKVVEVVKTVDKIVEKPVEVEKIVYRDRVVEKPIYIEVPMGAPQQQPPIVQQQQPAPAQIQQQVQPPQAQAQPIPQAAPVPVQQIQQPVAQQQIQQPPVIAQQIQQEAWEFQDNTQKELKLHANRVARVNEATFNIEVFAGKEKDYYFNLQVQALRQNFPMYRKVIFGDQYEERARENLRQRDLANPTPKALATELADMFKDLLEELGKELIDPQKQPEEWLDQFKERIKKEIST